MSEFILTKMEVKGFRGFTDAKVFEFGSLLTLFSGGNRRGKSSSLNAIEWCLFGNQVAAAKYGEIRERVGWEVKNLGASACSVSCEFLSRTTGKRLNVSRSYGGGKKPSFTFVMEDEPASNDDMALQVLLKVSPSDFVRAVHLHQEVLRNLITAMPGERKDAIDRLLGLSDLREIAKTLQDQKPKAWTQTLDQSLDDLSARLKMALQTKKSSVDQDTIDLKQAGLAESDFSVEGVVKFSAGFAQAVKVFASKYSLPEPELPTGQDLTAALDVLKKSATELPRLRQRNPVLQGQGAALIKKTRVEGLRDSYAAQSRLALEAGQKIAQLPDEVRETSRIDTRIAETSDEIKKVADEMQEVSKNAAVLTDALEYFNSRLAEGQLDCPICGQSNKTATDWREHIQSEIDRKDLTPLRNRKNELQVIITSLDTSKRVLLELEKGVLRETTKLSEIKSSIGKELNTALKDGDDPTILLSNEIAKLNDQIAELDSAVASINSQLAEFDSSARILERLIRVAKSKLEIARIEAVTETQAFKDLKSIRQQCEQFAEDVEILVQGLAQLTSQSADQRLSGAQTSISNVFAKLTARTDFTGLRVSAVKDGYAVELTGATSSHEALPILNQGDLNCAALSIFVALAIAPDSTHRLGFVVFDDPSQSLDQDAIERFATVLADICDARQVVLGTMDEHLTEHTLKIPKKKNHYHFESWDPTKGPQTKAVLA